MGYTVKWVEDNLGISRKAIRNFEEKGLIPKGVCRNPNNNYREYDEEDIKDLWNIKVFQGVGYTVREIKEMADDPDFDMYESISKKIEELKAKRASIDNYIKYAETIKLTGRIPTVEEIGSMRYDDYIQEAHERFNFGDEIITLQKEINTIREFVRSEEIPDELREHYIGRLFTWTIHLSLTDRRVRQIIKEMKHNFKEDGHSLILFGDYVYHYNRRDFVIGFPAPVIVSNPDRIIHSSDNTFWG